MAVVLNYLFYDGLVLFTFKFKKITPLAYYLACYIKEMSLLYFTQKALLLQLNGYACMRNYCEKNLQY